MDSSTVVVEASVMSSIKFSMVPLNSDAIAIFMRFECCSVSNYVKNYYNLSSDGQDVVEYTIDNQSMYIIIGLLP